MIVTLNSKLLGGNMSVLSSFKTVVVIVILFRSFFQSVCVLGYCLLPTTLSLIACRFILLVEQTALLFFIRFTLSMTGFVWATYGKLTANPTFVCSNKNFICSLNDFFGRQSETGQETFGCVPNWTVLLYNFLAGYIPYSQLRDTKTGVIVNIGQETCPSCYFKPF